MKIHARVRCFYVLLFIAAAGRLFSQNAARVEALEKELAEATEDSVRIKKWNSLAFLYLNSNPAKTLTYSQNVLRQTAKLETGVSLPGITNSSRAYGFYHIGWYHLNRGELPESLDHILKALALFEADKNTNRIALCYNSLGSIYKQQLKNTESELYYQKALRMLDGQQPGDFKAVININYGGLLVELDRYAEAWDLFWETKTIYEKKNQKTGWGTLYNNLGVCAKEMNRFDEAQDYFTKALGIYEAESNTAGVAFVLNSMGNTYSRQNRFDEALQAYERSLASGLQAGNKGIVSKTCTNLGEFYLKQGKNSQNAAKRFPLQPGHSVFHQIAGLRRLYSKPGKQPPNRGNASQIRHGT